MIRRLPNASARLLLFLTLWAGMMGAPLRAQAPTEGTISDAGPGEFGDEVGDESTDGPSDDTPDHHQSENDGPLGACLGAPISTIQLTGCSIPFCAVPGQADRFIQLTDLTHEARLTNAAATKATDRLIATGFFRSVTLNCIAVGGQAALTLAVIPHQFIREVIVEGNLHFRGSEIEKRIFLRPGTVLDVAPGEAVLDETIRRQVASIVRLYAEDGLPGVTITPRVEIVDAEAGLVDLYLGVTEGTRQRLRLVSAHHEATLPPGPDGIGCPSPSDSLLEEIMAVEPGDVRTAATEREVKKRLRAWFRSVGFVKPEVNVEIGGSPLALRASVRTERCWQVQLWSRTSARPPGARAALRFWDPVETPDPVGDAPFERVDLDDWRERLPFGDSGAFDHSEAERGRGVILGALLARGFFFADVMMEHRPRPRDSAGPILGVIEYAMTTNLLRRLRRIQIPGAQRIPEEELQDELASKVYDFFGQSGDVQIERVLSDLRTIGRIYRARGFHSFRFELQGNSGDRRPVQTRREEVDGDGRGWVIWEIRFRDRGFRLKKAIGEVDLTLEIPIVEGPQTQIQDVSFRGLGALDEAAARTLLALSPGGPHGTTRLTDGIERMERWYSSHGYPRAKVTASCEGFDPPPPDGLCLVNTVGSTRLDLFIAVDEGPYIVFGEVFWRGNLVTRDSVLTQDLPKAGDPYDPAAIAEASRHLRNRGVFDAVQITPVGLDEDPPRERVALVVTVEESKIQFLDLSLGFRTIDRATDERAPALIGAVLGHSIAASDRASSGFARAFDLALPDVLLVIEAEYINRNFLGYAHELRLPATLGLSTTENPVRLAAFKPTYTIPRIVTLDAQLETSLFVRYDRVTELQDYIEFGASLGLTWRPIERMVVSVGFTPSGIRFEDPFGEFGETAERPFHPQTRLTLQWRWDNQDNPLHPTKGIALSAGLSHIFEFGELVLAGVSSSDRQNNFLKGELSVEGVVEVPGIGLIIAAMARFGGAIPIDSPGTLLPLNERFSLGGSNGMRGFTDNGIGRYRADGSLIHTSEIGGNIVLHGSLELRLPLLERIGLWAVGFLDWGVIALDAAEFGAALGQNFRVSTGFGLRYLVGNQIPIRVDIGFPVPGPRESAPCPIGEDCPLENPFGVHFGFLYPF